MILRTRQGGMTAAARRVFTVLVVCWLNLAILPCAMAIGGSGGCPHMQPAAGQDKAHQGHHGSDTHADCVSTPSDCCELDDTTFDTRNAKIQNTSDDLSAFIPTVCWPALATLPMPNPEVRPPDPGGSFAPIHVLNCVYLK